MSSKDGEKHEIVIIRRGGHGHEEGHHGGMWKIAYADFMTAMMALFLVLWLVNSTDEKTQSQIASYFNPIDLSDKTTTERGVQDKNQAGTGSNETRELSQSGNTKENAPRNTLERSGAAAAEEELFSDPYDVLTKIAAKAAKLPAKQGLGGDRSSGEAQNAGDAFRDPFDPDFRFNAENQEAGLSDATLKREAGNVQTKEDGAKSEGKTRNPTAFTDKLAEEVDKAAKLSKRAEQELNESVEARQIRRELMRDIDKAHLAKLPDVSVTQTGEGILISLTDKADFEMFGVSSAEPRPELVVLMEQLAGILAKQTGKIVVRGHTDARPFKSKTYDNWRLSTARAHIAQYMLLRGGLPKERVERIEGYADRALKLPDDPNAAQNRRIEILIKPETT